MSLISKQVDDLRAYAKERKGELAKLVNDAADTIELLSAKLSASNMERSSQYYHNGWIPVSERLPREFTRVIGYMAWKAMTAIEYQNGKWYSIDHLEPLPDEAVTHWMPLPKPPKEGDE